jgi:hypothetical protein
MAKGKPSSFVNDSNQIAAVFANYFEHWHITLPDDAVQMQLAGKIQLSGWTIQYKFGLGDGGKFLDFYASHRMTNDRHLRIYASGETEGLPALSDMIIYPADASPEQQKKIEQKHARHNKSVMAILKQKGF